MSRRELYELFTRIGLEPKDLLSTRSRPYADMKLAERRLSADELLDLMTNYPALIRRPIVVRGSHAVVGFDRRGLQEMISAKEGER